MLQNAYFLAKIGADTAENEQHFAEILQNLQRDRGRRQGGELVGAGLRGLRQHGRGDRGLPQGHGKICKFLQIFGGLVLGCIETKFCKKICVRQHFSSSTRFAYFCAAAISKF